MSEMSRHVCDDGVEGVRRQCSTEACDVHVRGLVAANSGFVELDGGEFSTYSSDEFP